MTKTLQEAFEDWREQLPYEPAGQMNKTLCDTFQAGAQHVLDMVESGEMVELIGGALSVEVSAICDYDEPLPLDDNTRKLAKAAQTAIANEIRKGMK